MRPYLRWCLFVVLAASALLVPLGCEAEKPGADEQEMRALFEEARKLDGEGRHHEALVRYETILGKHPTWMSTRLNAAMAAYDSGQYQKAVGHFELIHKYGPTDWFIVRKLIQCYERVGRDDKVEEFRKKLTDLRNRQDGSPILKSYQGFTRDYIPVGTTMHLIGYEFFEPEKHGQFWLFKLEDLHRTPLSIFLIHSTPFHNGSGQRLFYLTEACPGWMRVWYVGPEGRDYDWARKRVTEILQSKHVPLLVKPVPLDLDLLNVPGGTTTDKPPADNTQEAEPKK
jgi:tetratricopeptide (TPR) repeat protein